MKGTKTPMAWIGAFLLTVLIVICLVFAQGWTRRAQTAQSYSRESAMNVFHGLTVSARQVQNGADYRNVETLIDEIAVSTGFGLSSAMKSRLVSAELAYRSGSLHPSPPPTLASGINALLTQFGERLYSPVDDDQISGIRMLIGKVVPDLLPAESGSGESPAARTFLTLMVLRQIFSSPDGLSHDVWLKAAKDDEVASDTIQPSGLRATLRVNEVAAERVLAEQRLVAALRDPQRSETLLIILGV